MSWWDDERVSLQQTSSKKKSYILFICVNGVKTVIVVESYSLEEALKKVSVKETEVLAAWETDKPRRLK